MCIQISHLNNFSSLIDVIWLFSEVCSKNVIFEWLLSVMNWYSCHLFSLFLYLVPCIIVWLNHQNWKLITAKSYEIHKAAFRAINLKARKSRSLGSRKRGFFIRRHMTQPKPKWSRYSLSRYFLKFSLRPFE